MPIHRGIKVNIVSQAELDVYPEFPHPESSQFTYRSSDLGILLNDRTSPYISHESKADRILGRQSVVSVYIPAFTGTRFWLRYSIEETAALQSKYYYFKLGANGENIASWGINAEKNPEGQIMRTLCEPHDKHNLSCEGNIRDQPIIESRWLLFSDEYISHQVRNQGLIEVLIFRARGRRSRLPLLSEIKDQNYGIRLPSQGILSKPHKCKYYDWYLKDPRDSPFVIFRFHYRNWDFLQRLKVISHGHPHNTGTPKLPVGKSSLQSSYKSNINGKRRSAGSPISIDTSFISTISEDQVQKIKSLQSRHENFDSNRVPRTIPPERMSPNNIWSSLVIFDKNNTTCPKTYPQLIDIKPISTSGADIVLFNYGRKLNPLQNFCSNQESRKYQTQQHSSTLSTNSISDPITLSLASYSEDTHTTAEIEAENIFLISNSPSATGLQSHDPKSILRYRKSRRGSDSNHNCASFNSSNTESSDRFSNLANECRNPALHILF